MVVSRLRWKPVYQVVQSIPYYQYYCFPWFGFYCRFEHSMFFTPFITYYAIYGQMPMLLTYGDQRLPDDSNYLFFE